MKPFNLEEAKAGKPLITRSGKPVRIACFDSRDPDQRPIIGLIAGAAGRETLCGWHLDGNWHDADNPNDCDLMMSDGEQRRWAVFHVYDGQICFGKLFEDHEAANKYVGEQSLFCNYSIIFTIDIEKREVQGPETVERGIR